MGRKGDGRWKGRLKVEEKFVERRNEGGGVKKRWNFPLQFKRKNVLKRILGKGRGEDKNLIR